MKRTARVVVIGGGIAGCSTLYHLTQEGWSDVMLLERNELTSGTTWHSAAQVTNFGMIQTMVGLKSHSVRLYRDLAADPDYPVGYNYGDGGIRLANRPEQMDGYRHFASQARGMGVEFEVIDAAECARRHPLISTENLLGGLWDPHDGHIDPAQLCQALARRARAAGAEVHRNTPVTGLTQRPDDSWTVHTDKGDIDCEIVVNACGYRVNEVGAMMGVHHPVMSMEHQYFITETMPQVRDAGHRIPLLRCPISDFYSRQERDGLLVGFYEQGCRKWGMDGIDPHFVNALCPDDLDRIMDVLEGAFARMPALREAGIKTIVNGPITYSMDGAPLVGPIPGKRNAFCIIGLRAGLGEGGGHGWLLAQQIVHGEAEYDTWGLDPRRFTGHANAELTALRAVEEYRNEFRFHYPHEHRPSGRPVKTTPLFPLWQALGAEFTVVNGWERVDYIRPTPDFTEPHGYARSPVEDVIAREIATLTTGVAMTEVNGFNRIEITGDGAHNWLDRITCGRLERRPGRVGLSYLLNDQGGIKSEATVANLPDGRIWYGSAAASEWHDRDWLMRTKPEGITLRPLTNDHTILVIAGPRARALLSAVARGDWSAAAFPWLSVRPANIGHAPAVVMAVSFSGELAYELHIPTASAHAAWTALHDAGAPMGLGHFGARAVESMRLEKGYRHWKADLVTEYTPHDSALSRFVDATKPDFTGKAALSGLTPRRAFASLVIDRADAPAQPGASIWAGDRLVGTVTSAAFGHRTGENLAMGFVMPDSAATGTALTIDILGTRSPATVVEPVRYDPKGSRMRA